MSGFYRLPFTPLAFFGGGHLQTVVAAMITSFPLPSTKRFVYLPDGDSITYEVSTPKQWQSTDPTVVIIHGLCGSSRSSYVVRVAKKFDKKGIRTIRMNLRGCGSGRGWARKMYHINSSDDVWHGLKKIKNETPDSHLIVIGFSLGGNIVLKMAGERSKQAKHLVDKLIAISPPIDLRASMQQLSKSKIYEKYFMFYLRRAMVNVHNHFSDLPPIRVSPKMSLIEFNEFYVAPQSGCSNAREYYYASSSGRFIGDININTHILFSRDDPIVNYNVLKQIKIPSNVRIFITDKGGHVGYLGMPGRKRGFYWMNKTLVRWVSLPSC